MNSYQVVYEQQRETTRLTSPDLPGCVAAADTQEDIEQMIQEAIELYIEALTVDGLPIPESQTRAERVAVAA